MADLSVFRQLSSRLTLSLEQQNRDDSWRTCGTNGFRIWTSECRHAVQRLCRYMIVGEAWRSGVMGRLYCLHTSQVSAMIDQSLFHYQVECAQASATIYVGGSTCSAEHVLRLSSVAGRLPRAATMLRVDLHAVNSIDLQSLMDLRAMMARWRSARNGTVRLLLRSPLPREAWPSSAIHFAGAPRLSAEPQSIALPYDLLTDIPRRRRVSAGEHGWRRLTLVSAGAL